MSLLDLSSVAHHLNSLSHFHLWLQLLGRFLDAEEFVALTCEKLTNILSCEKEVYSRSSILTPKQKKVLEYIESFTDRESYPPSQVEIARALGYRSLGTVQHYLVHLEREGYLVKEWNARRGVRVLRSKKNGFELPLAGAVAAGKPIEAIENRDTIEVPSSMVGTGENFVLLVKGDSMIGDGILDGDYVVVRKQFDADSGQIVVALINDEATVKRFYRKGKGIELHPANPTMSPIYLQNERSFRVEGVVVGVIRYCL